MNTKQAMEAAIKLRLLATEVDRIAMLLDSSKRVVCEHCGAEHWNNLTQKGLRERVHGASARLREIAEVFDKRQLDPNFLGIEERRDFLGNEEHGA
jgi:hypothetical protein